MMVGGIDKQIYLPYQLAQSLGFYKKYGVNMQLSTEQNGGVGAEEAMASGQVDMAGAWYVHTIDFQQKGKAIIDVVQLAALPASARCAPRARAITSPAQWKGKTVGVTDIGSGTDNLTAVPGRPRRPYDKAFSRAAVGAGPTTFVAALQHKRIVCGMTTPAHRRSGADQGVGYSAINLARPRGAAGLGGVYPAAGRAGSSLLGHYSHKDTVRSRRRRVGGDDALDPHPQRGADRRRDAADFVYNGLTTKATTSRARRGQGSVPARRDDARQRAADRVARSTSSSATPPSR